uniref:Uncharacterized protein n=1 Tax=Nelumbo nucifera TaxID=4432 RepID=A0A822XWP0_NELNU|nr:TPA_asm: hypothetical protein HUJ06_024648 [Nelumbo nucifera]
MLLSASSSSRRLVPQKIISKNEKGREGERMKGTERWRERPDVEGPAAAAVLVMKQGREGERTKGTERGWMWRGPPLCSNGGDETGVRGRENEGDGERERLVLFCIRSKLSTQICICSKLLHTCPPHLR